MGPLPKTVPFDADGVSAWQLLLRAEEAAVNDPESGFAKYKDPLVGVRVLGFFLLDFWHHRKFRSIGLRPYKRLLLEVKSCYAVPGVTGSQDTIFAAQHDKVFRMGLDYRNYLMRIFRSDSGLLPTTSSHASPPSFERARIEIIQRMSKADKTKSDVKSAALLRDGYKCLVSGAYDSRTCSRHSEMLNKAKEEGKPLIGTECAHLFSESAQDSNKSSDYAGTAIPMLDAFGYDGNKLLGGQVNRLSNVLTLSHDLHKAFDRFEFWLEETNTPNTYEVVIHNNAEYLHSITPLPAERVTFTVDSDSAAACEENGAALPELPSPTLIALRAACARVAHISGAAVQIDHILRDKEETTVMSGDGSSADAELLTSLINTGAGIRV